MLHEVLLALLGHPGAIIQEKATSKVDINPSLARVLNKAGTFCVPDSITFLTVTERAAINRVVGIGHTYRELRRFVRPASGFQSGNGEGLYVRALKVGVEELLDEYSRRIAEIERDVMGDPTLTLARVYAGVREYQSVLPAVADACFEVSRSRDTGPSKGAQVLELLNERSHFGAPDVRRRLCRIVWHCSQVLINQCISWLLHGLLVDPYQEFFIQKNKDPIAGSTAARSEFLASSSGLGLTDAASTHGVTMGADGTGGGVLESANVSWRAEEEWNSTYTLRLSMVPNSFVPHRLALKMLFVGKVVHVLRQANPSDQVAFSAASGPWPSTSVKGTRALSSGEGFASSALDNDDSNDEDFSMGVSEGEVLELTRRWTELRMREAFHLLSLERAVHQAHALVDRRLYRLLMKYSNLERHLHNLKGLFLMGHGALFHSFLDKAREAMHSTAGDRAVIDLNTWLAAAVEDQEVEEPSSGSVGNREVCEGGQSSASTLDIARLDLDPPGFVCKAFHDLAGFCLTGRAIRVSAKNAVYLCPGGSGGGDVNSPLKKHTKSPAKRAQKRGPGSGSIWYTSGREVVRGLTTSVAFRCDAPRPKTPSTRPSTPRVVEDGVGSMISFVIHNHRATLSNEVEGGGVATAVPNSLSVCLAVDGTGGGELTLRWNPHRGPVLGPPRQDTGDDAIEPLIGDGGVRVMARTSLPPTSGISVGQVNYLMVDYVPRTLGTRQVGGSKTTKAELMVYVNDPGRTGSAALSRELELWSIIEMGGGRAFVGVSAEGPWRTTLRQWELQIGLPQSVQGTAGPLGGVGSGPRVEEMLTAMDSWSGLLLHYRLEWPLHLVLTQETMQTYNRLFQMLVKVKRVNLELERVWPTLMQSRYRCLPQQEKAWLGPLWMLRARMAFFISNLAFYLQVDVVEAAYSVLQTTLAGVEDFVTLQRAHHQFLSTLRAKFYLDNPEITQGLGRALRHVLRFCCLFALHGNAKDIDVEEVASLQNAFQDEMVLLFPVLERLAKELAMRLDFNGHFSAQVA